MRYHLQKQTRLYDGTPYEGPTCGSIGLDGPAESNNLKVARGIEALLQDCNPVGWNIWDSTTGELVQGVDIFGDRNDGKD